MSIKLLTMRERQVLPAGRRISLMAMLVAWARESAERARQRHALARLSDFELRDIGLTRRDAEDETAKPFWRI